MLQSQTFDVIRMGQIVMVTFSPLPVFCFSRLHCLPIWYPIVLFINYTLISILWLCVSNNVHILLSSLFPYHILCSSLVCNKLFSSVLYSIFHFKMIYSVKSKYKMKIGLDNFLKRLNHLSHVSITKSSLFHKHKRNLGYF